MGEMCMCEDRMRGKEGKRRIKLTHCMRLIKRESLREWIDEATTMMMHCIKKKIPFALEMLSNLDCPFFSRDIQTPTRLIEKETGCV